MNSLAGDIPTNHLLIADKGRKTIMLYDFDDIRGTIFHVGTSGGRLIMIPFVISLKLK